MSFYRSYLRQPTEDLTYAYTCTYEDSSNPLNTKANPINNTTFNYPLFIGNHVNTLDNMLAYCTNFGSDIYIKGNITSCTNMLRGKDNSKRVNIFYNNVNGNTNASVFNSIVGGSITFVMNSSSYNCSYNTQYNIYIYNNYVE